MSHHGGFPVRESNSAGMGCSASETNEVLSAALLVELVVILSLPLSRGALTMLLQLGKRSRQCSNVYNNDFQQYTSGTSISIAVR
jgi:hypothetical protein